MRKNPIFGLFLIFLFFIGFLFSPPPYIHTLLTDDILPIPYDDLLRFLCLLVFDGHTRHLADEDVHAVFGRVHLSRDDARFRRPLLVVEFLVVSIHVFFRTVSSKRACPFFADMSRIGRVDVSRGQFVGVKVHCASWLLVAWLLVAWLLGCLVTPRAKSISIFYSHRPHNALHCTKDTRKKSPNGTSSSNFYFVLFLFLFYLFLFLSSQHS